LGQEINLLMVNRFIYKNYGLLLFLHIPATTQLVILTDKEKNNVTLADTLVKSRNGISRAWLFVAFIALVTSIVFSPVLKNEFTNWDDEVYVKADHLVATPSVPVVKIFKTPVSLHYHPLTILSLALNYRAGGLNPQGYYLVNIVLHVLNTMLVFWFIFFLTRRNLLMASVVSLFFGIHPMHVESVAWISERKDVLYVFFFMAALITYLFYRQTGKAVWYFSTLLLFILSCLSKEMAIVFPVILLLTDYLKDVKQVRRIVVEKIPFVIVAILLVGIEIKIQSYNSGHYLKLYTFFERVMFASYAAIIYIIRLFVPYKLSAFYPYPNVSNIPLIFYFSPFILILLLTALVYWYKKKQKELVFGLLFYFATIVLVVQFIPLNPAISPDRYSYLSYIGLLFMAAHVISKIWQSKSGTLSYIKYPVVIVVAIGAVIFSCQTYARTQVWKNSYTLWTNVIDNYPEAGEAYIGRGGYYSSINDVDKELAEYTKAIAIDSAYAPAYTNRGLRYLKLGKYDKAVSDFTKAIAFDSTSDDAYTNRGIAYLKSGNTNLALADLNRAIQLDSISANSYDNRGVLYAKIGRNDLAMADFNKAIEVDSTYADAYYDRGSLYSSYNNTDRAMADFNKALQLNPDDGGAYCKRGIVYLKKNDNDKALNDFTMAITLDTTDADAYNNRGTLYLYSGKINLALADYNKAIALNGSYAPSYFNRALCYDKLREYQKATDDYTRAIGLDPAVAVFWANRSAAEAQLGHTENAKADALKAQQLQVK